jgi:hypothetical protein
VESIPALQTVTSIHLCFVAAFVGLYACEAVVEGYGVRNHTFHRSAIRYHFLIDIFVELPIMFGVLVTGIILALLVDELTPLHFALIACGTFCVLFCPFCFLRFVRSRNRLLDQDGADEAALVELRRTMALWTLSLFNPLFLVALVIGLFLTRTRVIESL